jgi:hypothetical protein
MSRFEIDDFSGGRDKRPRLFYGAKKNLWRELDNAFIDKDKKVHRRWPLRYQIGIISGGVKPAAVSDNGVLTYFAPKGAPIADFGADIPTNVLQYDELPGHLADKVMWAEHYNGSVVALLRHQFYTRLGVAVDGTVTYRLHVFDGAPFYPTYVEDPYFPTPWTPSRGFVPNPFTADTLPSYRAYVPRCGIAAGKIYISDVNDNVAFCAPNNARVWNTRTPVQLRDYGEWWYWDNYEGFGSLPVDTLVDTTVDALTGSRWTIPEDPLYLHGSQMASAYGCWTCYVLEYFSSTDNTWRLMPEDPIDTVPAVFGGARNYAIKSTAGRFGRAEFGFQFRTHPSMTAHFRFRAIAGKPGVSVLSGLAWTSITARDAGVYSYHDLTVKTYETTPVTAPAIVKNYIRLLMVGNPNYVDFQVAPTGDVNFANFFDGLTGETRYRSTIVGWSYIYDDGVTVYTKTSLSAFKAYTPDSTTSPGQPHTLLGNQYEAGNESQFFINRTGKQATLAGFGLAGFLPTASRAKRDGGPVTAISAIRDYLGIHYRTLTLLYALNSNQLLDTIRDQSFFGTGAYSDGITVNFYQQTVVFSERGFRLFSIAESTLSDRSTDTNIGEPNETFPKTAVLRNACFWPSTGQYVAVLDLSGTRYLYVFDYSRESKISTWSRWRIGLTPTETGPCGLVPVADRLYIILASGGVAYLDAGAAAGQFYDSVDLAGAPTVSGYDYPSVAEGYQNTLGSTATMKQILSMDVVAQGETTVSFKVLAGGTSERPVPGFTVDGSTIGAKHALVSIRAAAVAPRFVSTDRNGWILDFYAIDFRNLKR